ncbi:P-loop containing nucleoside triphosphate hydrolase protein [Aaosphaeria arxii CBS 175.79]|uniref:P-loop containing nucleoside triphosphate hydrolase protein n=1 Tax=Aaosphaeria arxii CBS 175.79 TaxID=1450172 RepID=A0A6A5XZ29_9PLEO|nr:P-loop containing nucleoside triphosphate hydrolase protein [Aaosphaeria arxii CBS 175.79]KAF2018077.1 P-loop containing nucleoside triphosphate hydrolase protein [Aaosphaeria arxii CBS 175.79]
MANLDTNIRTVLSHILPTLTARLSSPNPNTPIILGITGLQGSGKSTWASHIVSILSSPPYNLSTITISLDDLYKTHADLVARRDADPSNALYRTRGQPGTHEEELARRFFGELRAWDGEGELKVPRFDKSCFGGEGDRAPREEWEVVERKPDVVVFEGWCVGFQAIGEREIVEKRERAEREKGSGEEELSITTLADHEVKHLKEVDEGLMRYSEAFMGPEHFDFLVHIDTDDLRNVYRWRLQQEHAMIEKKGSGMKDEAVVAFVKGYMPGYELYLDGLRKGFFEPGSGRQVRVVLDRERNVEKVEVIWGNPYPSSTHPVDEGQSR